MKSLGIVGFGSFGRFAAEHLKPHFAVSVTDSRPLREEAERAGLEWRSSAEIARCEVVVLAVPAPALEPAILALGEELRPGALVIDVCSVKQRPIERMQELLPRDVEIVGTHPMFGPQSGRSGIARLKVVLCPVRGESAPRVRSFLEDRLQLQVLEMPPERHDRQMAYVQGLTHWMAKALREITLPDLDLSTPAYRHLLKIEEILRDDSDELFLTIQRDNPFAQEARRELVRRLEEIQQWIEENEPR